MINREHLLFKHKALGGTVRRKQSSGKKMTKEEIRALAKRIEKRGGKDLGKAIRADIDRNIRRTVEMI